jgi:hypothetical protein
MPSLTTKNKRRIREAIDFLNSKRRPIAIRIEGASPRFSSRIIKADHGDLLAKAGMGGNLLIDPLSPEEGNDLIQSSGAIKVRFSIGKSECEFLSHYINRSVVSPYYGHIITYPEAITILDRRRDNRYETDHVEAPLFVSARITIKTSALEEKDYDLKVFDISENGVGLLVGGEMKALLEQTDPGKRLEEVELLASWTTIKVSGTVKHKSMVNEGKYHGRYLVGIRLDEKLEHYI